MFKIYGARQLYNSKVLNHALQTRSVSSYYKLFPKTLIQGPPPHGPCDIDLKPLRQEYLQAQKAVHPDVAQNTNGVTSAQISQAYKTLLQPISRAEHILSLNDSSPLVEDNNEVDNDLLIEVMDVSEQIQESNDISEIRDLESRYNNRISSDLSAMAKNLEAGDFGTAKKTLTRINYYTKLIKSLDEKAEELK